MRANPAISDRVLISESQTEGSLGRRLATRQAALRGMLAAGARLRCVLADYRLSTSRATGKLFLETEED
jgi:hypothetical protein